MYYRRKGRKVNVGDVVIHQGFGHEGSDWVTDRVGFSWLYGHFTLPVHPTPLKHLVPSQETRPYPFISIYKWVRQICPGYLQMKSFFDEDVSKTRRTYSSVPLPFPRQTTYKWSWNVWTVRCGGQERTREVWRTRCPCSRVDSKGIDTTIPYGVNGSCDFGTHQEDTEVGVTSLSGKERVDKSFRFISTVSFFGVLSSVFPLPPCNSRTLCRVYSFSPPPLSIPAFFPGLTRTDIISLLTSLLNPYKDQKKKKKD